MITYRLIHADLFKYEVKIVIVFSLENCKTCYVLRFLSFAVTLQFVVANYLYRSTYRLIDVYLCLCEVKNVLNLYGQRVERMLLHIEIYSSYDYVQTNSCWSLYMPSQDCDSRKIEELKGLLRIKIPLFCSYVSVCGCQLFRQDYVQIHWPWSLFVQSQECDELVWPKNR